jgi:DNA-binding response OmpR family regulator
LGGIVRKYPNAASRGHLLDCLYTLEADKTDAKIIDVYVWKLRRKLVRSGVAIITHYGFGFRLGIDKEAAA